jgi:hypothetical protein
MMPRRPTQGFTHSGYVKSGEQFYPCRVTGMSSMGATLAFDGPIDLPERFAIQMAANGKVARNCVVAWNEGTQFGVVFEGAEKLG